MRAMRVARDVALNGFTRATWVKGVVAALDQNDDKKVSWDEFTAAIK